MAQECAHVAALRLFEHESCKGEDSKLKEIVTVGQSTMISVCAGKRFAIYFPPEPAARQAEPDGIDHGYHDTLEAT
jgi:hypothetical protein